MTTTAAGSDNPAHANEGDTSNGSAADIDAKINRAITGHMKRLETKMSQMFSGEAVGNAVMAQLEQIATMAAESTPAAAGTQASGSVDTDKITQKARIEALEKQLQSFQKQAQDADGRARDASMRSRVQSEVAKFLPASDPNHAAYMGMLYDLQKRFVEADGNPAVKFKREWGEEMVPLEQGVKELFDGELKHLVQHSRAQSLPPAGFRGANGQTIAQAKPGPKFNPLLAEVASSIGESRPDFGRALMDAANGVVNGPNK